MPDVLFPNTQETLRRLDSLVCLFEWMRSMSPADREQLLKALLECSEATGEKMVESIRVAKDPQATPNQRQQALSTISDTLFSASSPRKSDSQPKRSNSRSHEEMFSQRLHEVMQAKGISQQELAAGVGCSQPAISQLLSRKSRPQKKTILKLAEALGIKPTDLWPDLETAELLDAVASFQQDDYEMTEAEAQSLRDTVHPNRPKIAAKSLPAGRRE